ncbi:MAG: replication-relaxation family protein [Xanthobacteraceae bacterium]|nr:replication-relaxation family protein [Xanthobacteraceae bacterium]
MKANLRRSRNHRTPTGKLARITPRHLEILGLLQRYRFLDARHIHALLGSNNSNVRRALGDLFHEHGLLNRLPQRAFMRDPLYDPEIYELSEEGEALLLRQDINSQPATWLKQCRYGAKSLAAHNLMICHVVAAIEVAAIRTGARFIPCSEILQRAPRTTQNARQPFAIPVSISHLSPNGRVQRLDMPVVPDAVFGLQYPNKTFRCFALEIDRNTMPLTRANLNETSYLRKLLQYRELISRGVYKMHFGLTETPMLLLTITTNAKHLEGIKSLLRELAGEKQWKRAFLFKAEPSLGSFVRAAKPLFSLFDTGWDRVGNPPFFINRTEN